MDRQREEEAWRERRALGWFQRERERFWRLRELGREPYGEGEKERKPRSRWSSLVHGCHACLRGFGG